jgi:hypothetical protein
VTRELVFEVLSLTTICQKGYGDRLDRDSLAYLEGGAAGSQLNVEGIQRF